MAPLEVNSTVKVTNLNADLLDGVNSTELLLGTATIPSGVTVTGAGLWDHAAVADGGDVQFLVELPGRAPVALSVLNVNFAPSIVASDGDATCTGTATAPTAPAGKVCIYIVGASNLDGAMGTTGFSQFQDRHFRIVFFTNTAVVGDDMFLQYTWAYTAP